MSRIATIVIMSVSLAVVFCMNGCGGGGSSTAPTVSGTASEGGLLTGKVIKLKDANGRSATDTTTNAITGSYSVNVAGLTAPFLVMVTGNNGTYVSLAQTTGIANINPITTLVVALAARNPDVLGLFADLTPAQVAEISLNYTGKCSLVAASLQPVLPAFAKIQDYFTDTIVAGKGIDALFDNYQIVTNAYGIMATAKDANATTVLMIPAITVMAETTQALPTIVPISPVEYRISGELTGVVNVVYHYQTLTNVPFQVVIRANANGVWPTGYIAGAGHGFASNSTSATWTVNGFGSAVSNNVQIFSLPGLGRIGFGWNGRFYPLNTEDPAQVVIQFNAYEIARDPSYNRLSDVVASIPIKLITSLKNPPDALPEYTKSIYFDGIGPLTLTDLTNLTYSVVAAENL